MFQITDAATKQFKSILTKLKDHDSGIRVFISNGCCGASIGAEFAKKGKPGDIAMDKDGLKVFVAAEAATPLENVTIDYGETPRGRDFMITGLRNPSSGCC